MAYPELRAVLGGASAVPDLRGLFLRGYGSQSHAQENGSTVGVTSTLHASGSLGDVQGDAARNITADFGSAVTRSGSGVHERVPSGAVWYSSGRTKVTLASGDQFYGIDSTDASRVVPTASENRPVNTAVRYLIRAFP
jgi:hypothetical protein